jgi:putative transposase
LHVYTRNRTPPLDGFGMGEHLLVGALGVTADGTKVPLGVVEGTTENKSVCLRLVTGLRDRGLDPERGVLFVIDGGKALAAAVRGTFGSKALIQRCRRHKERNVLDHLPEAERPLTQRRLRSAWATAGPDQAQHELEALAAGLARKRPGAAASLREGLTETPDGQPARRRRQAVADHRVDQPRREHDRDRP